MSEIPVTPARALSVKPVFVVADDRERGSELFQLLEQSPVFDLHVRSLPRGDYMIENQVTVERKSYDDFAVSLVDGRLFSQAAELSRLARPVILIEGLRERVTSVNRHALKGALLSLATAWRLPVVFSRDAAESAWILEALGRQTRPHTPLLKRGGYRPKRLQGRRSFVLQGLPGIGRVLANRLLERFGTVRGVFAAPEQELAEVCGPKRAEAIAKLLD